MHSKQSTGQLFIGQADQTREELNPRTCILVVNVVKDGLSPRPFLILKVFMLDVMENRETHRSEAE